MAPFKAEHLGSLLRPKELLQARVAFEKGEINQQRVAEIENESVNKIVKVQTDIGFRAVSDGEYRRAVFWGTFFEELEGMTEIRNPPMEIFRPYVPDIAGFIEKGHKPGQSCVCTGKIRHKGKSTLIGQFEYLKTLIPEERWGDIKVTMIAPPWYHLRYKDGKAFPKEVYSNDEEYFEDISKAFRTELDILYAAGVRNIQFDDPNFACKTPRPPVACANHQTSAPRRCSKDGPKTSQTQRLPMSFLILISSATTIASLIMLGRCTLVFTFAEVSLPIISRMSRIQLTFARKFYGLPSFLGRRL
jgi:methionine synthase II (cobalamin-independent)